MSTDLIKRSSCHFFQCLLVMLQIFEPAINSIGCTFGDQSSFQKQRDVCERTLWVESETCTPRQHFRAGSLSTWSSAQSDTTSSHTHSPSGINTSSKLVLTALILALIILRLSLRLVRSSWWNGCLRTLSWSTNSRDALRRSRSARMGMRVMVTSPCTRHAQVIAWT